MFDDPDSDKEEEVPINELIINAIKIRTSLWNMYDKLYKDNIHKKKLWAEIAYELKIDEDFVRKRWKNLRDKYLKLIKKSKTKSGQAAVTRPSWAYMVSMSFLSGVVEPRQTTTNMAGVFTLAKTTLLDEVSLSPTSHNAMEDAVDLVDAGSSTTGSQELSRPSTNESGTSKLRDFPTNSDCGSKRKRSSQHLQNSKHKNDNSDPLEKVILSIVNDRPKSAPAKQQELTSEEHFYLSVAHDVQHESSRLRMRMRQAVLESYVEIFVDEYAP